jgi:hypothetical protein
MAAIWKNTFTRRYIAPIAARKAKKYKADWKSELGFRDRRSKGRASNSVATLYPSQRGFPRDVPVGKCLPTALLPSEKCEGMRNWIQKRYSGMSVSTRLCVKSDTSCAVPVNHTVVPGNPTKWSNISQKDF